MTAKNARLVANAIMWTAGGALAVLAWRQPFVRRAVVRAVPLVLRGTPPLQVAAFIVARAMVDRTQPPRALGYATERGNANDLGDAQDSRPTALA